MVIVYLNKNTLEVINEERFEQLVDDESVSYHVELDNDHGHYIFGGSQVFDLIKKELGI